MVYNCGMQKQLELLRKYEIGVKGVRGQHFLIDPNIQRKIVHLVDPKPGETVLEIGPGLGAITEELLKSGANVIAVDSDKRFCEILKTEYGKQYPNLKILHADILSVPLNELIPKNEKLKAVGNLPYYITSPILMCLISNRNMVSRAVLMIQKEMAERMAAKPKTKDYGRLTLITNYYAHVERAFNVSPTCFSPKPRVQSSVVKLDFSEHPEAVSNETFLFEIIKYTFLHRRKNILNALAHELKDKYPKGQIETALENSGIHPKKRGEELEMNDFVKLTEALR